MGGLEGARTGGLGSAIITSARQAEAVQSRSLHIYMAINIIQHMAERNTEDARAASRHAEGEYANCIKVMVPSGRGGRVER